MVSQRNKTVIRGYSGFEVEDIQYLIGTRLPNSITEWKFPTQAERDTRGTVVLIGDDINAILR
jgi:trehalose/maltose hydrolase-like predicted phosphorylase